MRVEVHRTEKGFLIPMVGEFKDLEQDKITIEVEIIEALLSKDSIPNDKAAEDNIYAAMDEMVGMCDSGKSDGSVNHDQIIYELKNRK